MFTYLGIAGKINDNDINENTLRKSDLIFLEGYLWDEGEPQKAFNKAIKYSKKIAMTLSDKFCVDRHRVSFLELVKNKLDVTFANEQEMISLIEAKKFGDVIDFAKQIKKLIVITRGEKGAIAIFGEKNSRGRCKKKFKHCRFNWCR